MTNLNEIELDTVAGGVPVGALPLGAVIIAASVANDIAQQSEVSAG